MSKSTRITKKRTSASIITISQLIRYDCLLNLYELIKLQTYKNIVEWVITEGSKTKEDATKNKINVNKLIEEHSKSKFSYIKIVYLEYSSISDKNIALSDLRNFGNSRCTGDIIVCMDDDDYYPTERVQHAVESLENSPCQIAACSDIYLYEYFMGKLYKFKGFHQNHGTNNTMAYKKEYLRNHRHQPGLIMAEEKSFTNDFTSPMVQLNSKKCIIVSSHNFNTFNKREICVGGTIGINTSLFEVDHSITSYIPEDIFNRMKSLFYKEEKSPYDIVYFCGGLGTAWDPKCDNLGGSEQAIVQLCEYWAKIGKKVAVYADILSNKLTDLKHNNVEYKNWKLFEFNHRYKCVILWRTYGLYAGLPFDIYAENLFIDIHDNFDNQVEMFTMLKKYFNKITKILFKSNFHKNEFEKHYQDTLDEDKYFICANGIQTKIFENNWDNCERNKYRYCYVSYYSRGLESILKHMWPIIKKLEPKSELHLYYGLEMFKDEKMVLYF